MEDAIRKQTLPSTLDTKTPSEIDQFTTKVQEANAYLQILIEQSKDLDKKIKESTDADATASLKVVKTTLDELIENVKQSVLHLLMARQSTVVAESKEILGLKSYDFMSASEEGASSSSGDAHHLLKKCESESDMKAYTEEEIVNNESEDDFFDAESFSPSKEAEGGNTSHHLEINPDSARESAITDAEASGHRRSGSQLSPPVLITDESAQYDELYDDFDDEQLESLDQHGSLIRHLLAQVRIGMDLTKVVLPTFILERRSLLEMFADFFAHPDMFVDIATKPTPKERLTQVVRWYLSAFHAGRRNQVAKKPYNPILGETFRCHWSLPTSDSPTSFTTSAKSGSDEDKIKVDPTPGPVPWARNDCLTFSAEQVSHHPPISAFYAEHIPNRISLDGYIWTKSKFLGLSIGVYMVGQATVCLLNLDEQYTITFPTAYGRSILTVPWIELGGTVNISCAKTGYSASIEFLTKPFYGGRRHQINANLYDPAQPRKAFMHIEGAWNGIMYSMNPDGSKEVFVDTLNMPIVKKTVRSIDEQEETESRRLWSNVTLNLKRHNVTKATEFKHSLEQKQREDANYRKDHGIPWSTKYFDEIDGHWLYRQSLINRLKQSQAAPAQQQQQQQPSGDKVLSSN